MELFTNHPNKLRFILVYIGSFSLNPVIVNNFVIFSFSFQVNVQSSTSGMCYHQFQAFKDSTNSGESTTVKYVIREAM